MYYTFYSSSFCEIILAGDENGLIYLHLNTGEGKSKFEIEKTWEKSDIFFADVKNQLTEYFEGKRKKFEVKINPRGTDFQKKVWNALMKIPYGETFSYQTIAKNIGNEKASRAVGMANSKNPIPIIVPCHRVIGKNGKLTGFASGLKIKGQLLDLEK